MSIFALGISEAADRKLIMIIYRTLLVKHKDLPESHAKLFTNTLHDLGGGLF